MRHSAPFHGAFILLAIATQPALANVPPGPQAIASLLLMPLSVVAFSLMGGAYIILNRKQPTTIWSWISHIVGAGFLVFGSAVMPEVALLALPVFFIWGFKRAIEMFKWAGEVSAGKPEVVGASITRLRGSGAGLALSTLILALFASLFIIPWHGRYEDDRVILRFVAYQLDYGAFHKRANGNPYFDNVIPGDNETWTNIVRNAAARQTSDFEVHYGKDFESFTLLVIPKKLPPFPISLLRLDSMPSFRADQTGQIRMVLVHSNGEVCPADAPVVHVVSEKEVSAWHDLEGRDPEVMESQQRKRDWAAGHAKWLHED